VRRLLRDFGVEIDDEELDRFLEAEHRAWDPARVLAAHTHPLLEALREHGLKLGLVSNAFDPGWLLHRDLEQMGLAERLDFSVFSSEVGMRKPHPAIFERALTALGAAPERTLFVGDRLYEDVRGAGELGMTTVQALWFGPTSTPTAASPTHLALTQFDVLNIARRLVAA
jgi:putative hydrolase of the HAD superfamily